MSERNWERDLDDCGDALDRAMQENDSLRAQVAILESLKAELVESRHSIAHERAVALTRAEVAERKYGELLVTNKEYRGFLEQAERERDEARRALAAIIALDDELVIYGNTAVRSAMDEGRRALAQQGEGR